jgi:predicted  nucleic acid-binding Zn-ribbon protein
MPRMSPVVFCFFLLPAATLAATANPIRKVVTMLQNMQAKVEEEGKKEKELFDKFMCYCKSSGSDLTAEIDAAGVKMPSLASDIKESEAQLAQTKDELKAAQSDRSAAKSAMASATAMREKEAAAYKAESEESEATISACNKAVAALEKGMAGAFLQTAAAKVLKNLALGKQDMLESDRDAVLSFLSGSDSSGYAPSSGEVTGILKQMSETMSTSLAEASAAETAAIKTYEGLLAAKKSEVEALTSAIEAKTVKVGDLGVAIVQMKNDLSETETLLIENKKFLAEMAETCKTKEAEWAAIVKARGDELVALGDTIKILNDDDALELFKKTLPSAGSSFLQVAESASSMRQRALEVLAGARKSTKRRSERVRIDLISLALHGKTADFAKVIALIDDMVKTLMSEQTADDDKKEYCATAFDQADDKKKGLEASIADAEAAIASIEEGIATVKDEIASLEKGIKALDKAVVEATEQRQEEHQDYTELMASDTAAKELLGFAKNRLNKFYNPKLYKAPPKRALDAEDTIVVSMGGTLAPTAPPGGIADTGISFAQVSEHVQRSAAPPPAPEAPGAFKKKSEESTGVISMIDLLIADLDKELTESETTEKESQKEYEEMMADSKEKRKLDSAALSEKGSAKAALEGDLEAQKETHASASKEHMATLEFIHSLHGECDWLLKYFDVRKEARTGEIDALKKAKDVLAGADYSLLQLSSSRGFLARSK